MGVHFSERLQCAEPPARGVLLTIIVSDSVLMIHRSTCTLPLHETHSTDEKRKAWRGQASCPRCPAVNGRPTPGLQLLTKPWTPEPHQALAVSPQQWRLLLSAPAPHGSPKFTSLGLLTLSPGRHGASCAYPRLPPILCCSALCPGPIFCQHTLLGTLWASQRCSLDGVLSDVWRQRGCSLLGAVAEPGPGICSPCFLPSWCCALCLRDAAPWMQARSPSPPLPIVPPV